ncbi:hypothetical protein WKH31_11025 [Metabacillus indicus]|uniref:GH39 family glycosyl hydrolase n=1 Tax=Metabacillus indicus TaxID=246786 RepID=UPI003174BF41
MNIVIETKESKKIHNFWNHIHFHPTDAIEDDWGKRILNKVAEDRVAQYIRLYTMFEDIVSRSKTGELRYDFTLNDHRLDYLLSIGLKPLICFNFMPRAIAKNPLQLSVMERYKKKRINFSEPENYEEWQEICFQYAAHIVERYGLEQVKTWYLHCWNEPDFHYWLEDVPYSENKEKLPAYCKLYDFFAAGIKKVSLDIRIGGPSACYDREFVDRFLKHTKEEKNYATGEIGAPIDFFSIHVYPRHPSEFALGLRPDSERMVEIVQEYTDISKKYGYENLELIADEWGASASGNHGTEEWPDLFFRDTEYFPAYYVRMVDRLIQELPKRKITLSKMMICLSGSHHLDRDFEGYRSFFTLNEFPKPIYNGFALMGKLGNQLLPFVSHEEDENVGVVPTKDENGNYKIAVYYTDQDFYKQFENRKISVEIKGLEGKYRVRHYRIDQVHSNAYTKFKEIGSPVQPTQLEKQSIQQAGKLQLYYPESAVVLTGSYEEQIVMTPHSVSLIELEKL